MNNKDNNKYNKPDFSLYENQSYKQLQAYLNDEKNREEIKRKADIFVREVLGK